MRHGDLQWSLSSNDVFLLAIDTVNVIGVDVAVFDVILVILDFESDDGMFERKDVIVAIEFLNIWMEITEIIVVASWSIRSGG